MVRSATLLAALLLYSPQSFAWGGLAHEPICKLALLELDDTARKRGTALIRQVGVHHVSRAMQLGRQATAACVRALRQSPPDATSLDGMAAPR